MLRGLVLVAVGCFQPRPALDVPCAENGACPDGQHCDTAQSPPRCVFIDVDAALADAAADDAPGIVPPDASVDAALHGTLVVTADALASGDIDLTAEGTRDWAHWGLVDVTSFDRKAGGAGLADETVIGQDSRKQGQQVALTSSWSDGTPDVSAAATATALSFQKSTGVQLVIPAGTQQRTLRLYVGVKSASARLDLALSDNAAAPVSDLQTDNTSTPIHLRYKIVFAANSDGQTLTIGWTETAQLGAGGLTELISATLQ